MDNYTAYYDQKNPSSYNKIRDFLYQSNTEVYIDIYGLKRTLIVYEYERAIQA